MQLQYSRQSYKMSMALFRLCYYLHKQFSHPFSSIIYIIKYREEIAISSYVDEKTYHSIIIWLYNIRYAFRWECNDFCIWEFNVNMHRLSCSCNRIFHVIKIPNFLFINEIAFGYKDFPQNKSDDYLHFLRICYNILRIWKSYVL